MSNTIVLITGANTGLGFEIVKALCQSKKSYTILVGGRSLDKAKAAITKAESVKATSSTQLHAVQIDIEDDNSISNLYEAIDRDYGRIDVLVNNAGKLHHQHASPR
jgi:NAD(P)-dependent dehydrogenase (short-subunit alcohol dehydrogenase family)